MPPPRIYETTVGVTKTGGIKIQTFDEWLEETGFIERAAADAKANQPAADSNVPTATLIDLHAFGLKRAQLHVTVAEQELQSAITNLTETRVRPLNSGMAEAQIENDLLIHGEQHRENLDAASLEAGKRLRDQGAFKHARSIDREAVYAENPANAIAALFLIGMAEAAVNALFFKGAHDGGLLGSFMLTVVVAAVNVAGFGFLAGMYGAPWAFSHLSRGMRTLGWVLLVGAAVGAFGLNLFVSHYRDAALMNTAVEFSDIVPVLFQPWKWLNYHQFTSLVLFLVGLGCAALGFLKGYRYDDPIWGYGEVTRKAKAAEARRRDLIATVGAEMQAIMTRKADALKANHDAQSVTVQEHRSAIAAVERVVSDRHRAIVMGDQAIARAQREYFDVNRRIRPDALMPAWAQTPPTYAHLADQLPALDTLRTAIAGEEATLAGNYQIVVGFIRELPKLREAVINEFLMRIKQADQRAVSADHLGPQQWDQMYKKAAE